MENPFGSPKTSSPEFLDDEDKQSQRKESLVSESWKQASAGNPQEETITDEESSKLPEEVKMEAFKKELLGLYIQAGEPSNVQEWYEVEKKKHHWPSSPGDLHPDFWNFEKQYDKRTIERFEKIIQEYESLFDERHTVAEPDTFPQKVQKLARSAALGHVGFNEELGRCLSLYFLVSSDFNPEGVTTACNLLLAKVVSRLEEAKRTPGEKSWIIKNRGEYGLF